MFKLFDYDFVVNFRQFQVDFGGFEFVAKNHNRIARNGVKSHLRSLRLKSQIIGLFIDAGKPSKLPYSLFEQRFFVLILQEVTFI